MGQTVIGKLRRGNQTRRKFLNSCNYLTAQSKKKQSTVWVFRYTELALRERRNKMCYLSSLHSFHSAKINTHLRPNFPAGPYQTCDQYMFGRKNAYKCAFVNSLFVHFKLLVSNTATERETLCPVISLYVTFKSYLTGRRSWGFGAARRMHN